MFNNLKIAFEDKSDKDLHRAYFLFKIINNQFFSKILTLFIRLFIYIKMPISKIALATIYKHFCGGVSIIDSEKTINKLAKSNIQTVLDYSSEGNQKEETFEYTVNEIIKSIESAKANKNIPFTVFKPSGIAKFNILEKINNNELLTNHELSEKKLFIGRIEKICKTAYMNKVSIFIDAEESWIQDGIDKIALEMMKKYNKEETYIYNTVQMYRKGRLKYIQDVIEDAINKNYFIGLKIVRGAYHEKEINRSKKLNYECPVFINKNDTDKDFNNALFICIKNINKVSICAGTHNEKSSEMLITLLNKYNICKNDKRIYFSQLLGMSDNISYNAAKQGYNVAKYVPYGPVNSVLPYLIRRAEENTSISGQMGRELNNIIKEKKRRKKDQ